MTEEHARSDRVLDAGFLADLGERSVDELRAMHAECLELETEVSYVRRLTQARIDILEAEIGRRERGDSLEDLINSLPQILADSGPRAIRRRAVCRCRWHPRRTASGRRSSRRST